MSLRQAAVLARSNTYDMMKAAVLGKVKVRVEAGTNIRFAREDVERLAAEAE
jgi:hypothetical protein